KQDIKYLQKPNNIYSDCWRDFKKLVIQPASKQSVLIDEKLLHKVNELKSNNVDTKPFNPFEKTTSIFINRSAVKLAELDYLYQLKCSSFVDLCGGPGGFSEYLVWKYKAKGYGITLRGNQDYKIDTIKKFYGKDGTGDITRIENIKEFVLSVPKVELAVADGGFSVLNDERNQEEQSKELLLSQILVAMQVLVKGGTLVLKLFETKTVFTLELLYLLYLSFDTVSIIKPKTSRPCNSEKFIVCKAYQESQDLQKYLEKVLAEFSKLKQQLLPIKSGHKHHQSGYIPYDEKIELQLNDVNEILDWKIIEKDEKFVDYIENYNLT
ncbi:FtsJ methyltransferase domain-containing protein 2, partial [Terramyces sp. JEL0728]